MKALPQLSKTLAFVAPAVALTTTRIEAADIFLKIDSIVGESKAEIFPAWIEVASMQYSVTNSSTATTSGKPQASELTITKSLDSSSPPLFVKCVKGELISEFKMEVAQPDSSGKHTTFYKIVLNNVRVTSLKTDAGGDGRPAEIISFSYQKIRMEYSKILNSGKTELITPVSWDFVTNK